MDYKERKPVAQIGNFERELIKFVEKHQVHDPLVVGFNQTTLQNPFRRAKVNRCSPV